jgi:hypothetical protein
MIFFHNSLVIIKFTEDILVFLYLSAQNNYLIALKNNKKTYLTSGFFLNLIFTA